MSERARNKTNVEMEEVRFVSEEQPSHQQHGFYLALVCVVDVQSSLSGQPVRTQKSSLRFDQLDSSGRLLL